MQEKNTTCKKKKVIFCSSSNKLNLVFEDCGPLCKNHLNSLC